MTNEEAIYTLRGLFIPCASDGNKWGCDRNEALEMAIEALQFAEHFDLLKEFQSLQEVVRCKDCRHQRFYINDKESFYCHKSGVVNMHMEDGDGEFFCSYGERKKP